MIKKNFLLKVFIGLSFICFGLTNPVSAQVKGVEIHVVVSPDHEDWTYQENKKCVFTIQVYKAQNLLKNVKINYELGPVMYPLVTKKNIVLKDGKLEVSGMMSEPGFLRCTVTAHVGDSYYKGLATAAYVPEKINAFAVCPEDFDDYWAHAISEARKTSLEPMMVLLPERCTDKVNVYQVSFQNVRPGSRWYGILCMPKAPGKYPALLRVPGAGIRPYFGDTYLASKGAIVLEVGIHGIPVTMEQSYYDKLFYGALYHYWEINDNDRDAFYYNRVYLSVVRSVDFICSLPEYNRKSLGITGASQGGALSIAGAALDKRITFLAAIHPAMCDLEAALHERACGWPHYFYQQKNFDEMQLKAVRYYDTVNFARRITVPGWYSWGYNDEVCSPTSMYAAYNSITAEKEIHPYLETGHYWYQEQYDAWNLWLCCQMGLVK